MRPMQRLKALIAYKCGSYFHDWRTAHSLQNGTLTYFCNVLRML